MLSVSTAGWAATLLAIGLLLLDDLVRASRRPAAMGLRRAAVWSAAYLLLALLFGVLLGALSGWAFAGQYLTGFVVEKSLSLDNLFVFVIIIASFGVPAAQESRALSVGVALALVLRAVFIAAGAALLDAFSFMFLIFGLMLVFTGVQLYRHREEDPDVTENVLLRFARRTLPVTDGYRGGSLAVRTPGGLAMTPMMLVLLALASTDLLFAFDSIPAVFGITQSSYIVFCANAFALLGLRPLYFLVRGFLDRLVYLSTGLAAILLLIGVKLILHFAHGRNPSVPEISTGVSLAAIVAILAVAAVSSMRAVARDPQRRGHAGRISAPREREEQIRD
jgi:tellurite resistance protein TerC